MSKNSVIFIDGVDGCGKTTLGQTLVNQINETDLFGSEVIALYVSPFYSKGGEALREVLMSTKNHNIQAMVAQGALQYALENALKGVRGDGYKYVLVVDRSIWSMFAYQNKANDLIQTGIRKSLLKLLKGMFVWECILDVPVEVAYNRIKERGLQKDKYETLKKLKKHHKWFLKNIISNEDISNVHILDGTKHVQENIEYIRESYLAVNKQDEAS